MNRPQWECGVEKLTGAKNEDQQTLARKYADGFVLVQIVTFFPGNVLAYFHRPVDVMADFERTDARTPGKVKSPEQNGHFPAKWLKNGAAEQPPAG